MNFMESAGDLFLLWLFSSWKNLNYKKTWRRKSGGSWSVCWYCSPCFSIPEIISFFKKSGGTHSLFVLFFFVGSYIQTDKEVYTSVVHIHCVCVSDIYVTLRWFTFIVNHCYEAMNGNHQRANPVPPKSKPCTMLQYPSKKEEYTKQWMGTTELCNITVHSVKFSSCKIFIVRWFTFIVRWFPFIAMKQWMGTTELCNIIRSNEWEPPNNECEPPNNEWKAMNVNHRTLQHHSSQCKIFKL